MRENEKGREREFRALPSLSLLISIYLDQCATNMGKKTDSFMAKGYGRVFPLKKNFCLTFADLARETFFPPFLRFRPLVNKEMNV